MQDSSRPSPHDQEVSSDIRADEQRALLSWLEAEHGSVVVIHGPRGVGKARLADYLKQEAAQRGDVAVLEARCPAAGGRSFHPFSELARQAMVWAEQRGLTESLVDPVYAELSPVIDHAISEDTESEAPSLDQKLGFFDSFRRLLSAIGAQARLCAIVHDFERADTDTLELASYLADELFGDPTLDPGHVGRGVLVLLAREDKSVEPRIQDFISEVKHRRTARSLGLQGLDLDGLRLYVQSPHVLEKLLAASSGLPQEVDALIEALPTNVEELFERRLDTLDSLAREILLALSVSGRPASSRQLAEVTGHAVKEVARALNELRSERILSRRIQSGEFQFLFSRRRDLEVAQRLLPSDDRARLHGGWAKALSQELDAGGPALLAHHQLRSTEPQRGVPLAVQAAETHAVSGAINAAIQILEDARPHAAGELKLAILSRLAELAPLAGNPRRALRFVEEWQAALQPERKGPALRREAELHNAAGDYQRALESLHAARTLLEAGEDHAELAGLEATASEAHYHLSALDDARECCEVGLELLAATDAKGALRVRLELLNQLGKIALADGDPKRAIRFFEETLEAATHHGLVPEQARALVNIGIVRLRQGELVSAKERLHRGIEKARAGNDLSRLAFGHMSIGALHHQAGELGLAIEAYRECRSLFRRLGNRTQLARVLNNLGNLYFLCGDLSRARGYNQEAFRLAELSGVERVKAIATVVDGVIFGEEGRYEEAEARLSEGMLLQQRLGGDRPIEAMIELADLHRRQGATDRAGAILREAIHALESIESPALKARATYLEGVLEADPALAVDKLEAARQVFSELGRRLLERDAELALARALKASGRTEMAKLRLDAARRLQGEAAAGLPDDLKTCFESARPQQLLGQIGDELSGKTPSAWGQRARPRPRLEVATEPVERKPEWKDRYGAIIGRSPKLLRVFHILDRVSRSDGTVLIVGESGTGKELVAEAVHRNSARASGPFVKLNCAALVESLLLSELFGHERGSFTGAHQRKIGRFEMAAGGTLFLDEIGDISPKTQVALLRVLQEREFERVGGGQTLSLDARIVFATNRNLGQMVREGTFREDLYYRLKGITIDLPPLRERPEDIVALADHFLDQYAKESGAQKKTLAPDSLGLLARYPWPGNIRELENIIRSVALFAEEDTVYARDFDEYRELFQDVPLSETPLFTPPGETIASAPAASYPSMPAPVAVEPSDRGSVGGGPNGQDGVTPVHVGDTPDPRSEEASPTDLLGKIFEEGIPLPELKKQIQAEAIARALKMTEGNITKAADVLGMRRPRLSQIINADETLKRLAQGTSR